MTFAYARTREREKAWKFGIYCFMLALTLSIPMDRIFKKGPIVGEDDIGRSRYMYQHDWTVTEVRYESVVLESIT
jgi:hypothetical protein